TRHPDTHVLRQADRGLGPVAERLPGAHAPRVGVQAGGAAAPGRDAAAGGKPGGLSSRLFVAAVPPAPLRDQLAALSHRHSHPGVRWLPAENLHVTVLFLGDVDDERIEGLATSLRAAAAFTDPFELEITHARPAPERRPRMLWALVAASEPLLRLSRDMHGAARSHAPGRKPPLRGF